MTEFVFISANDLHISDMNPRARTDNYKEAILDKISQWRMACVENRADAALCAGDLFNIKYPSKNSHRLNQQLITEFQKFPCPVYMIEGNHDLTADSLDSLKEQPLGVLFAAKALIQLRHEVLVKDGQKVSLVGIPYTHNFDPEKVKIPENNGYLAQICLLHLYASLKAGNLFKEKLYGYDELSVMSPDIFIIGHYHVDQGICKENEKYFVNIGSIGRGTLSEENIEHKPKLGLIRISLDQGKKNYVLSTIELKVRPAGEIFDLVKKEEEKKENQEIELFVDTLADASTFKPLAKEDLNMDSMDIAADIKKRALHYIQEARMAKAK